MLKKIMHKYLRLPYKLHVGAQLRVKRSSTIVLFLHGIGQSSRIWQETIDKLPADVGVVSLDLLGFGRSPMPTWARYDVNIQARSVRATLRRIVKGKKVIVVGHSLGSLIAVELARSYPKLVSSLVLCSPPLYHKASDSRSSKREERLKRLYGLLHKHPERIVEAVEMAVRYKLIKRPISISHKNIGAYLSTLEASIVNQTSLDDARELELPISIIHGAFDPFVVKKNLKSLSTSNLNADLQVIRAGHEIKSKTYTSAIVAAIRRHT